MQDDTGNPTPDTVGDPTLAAALSPFLDRGFPQHGKPDGRMTSGTPAELARMFADLAARLAAIAPGSLPEGVTLSVNIGMQSHIDYDVLPVIADHEAAEVAAINAVACYVAPGLSLRREKAGASIHYGANPYTAAGLRIDLYTSVQATEAEAAMLLRRRVEAAHVATVEPAGMTHPASGLPMVTAVCRCTEYTSTVGERDDVKRRFEQHRTSAVRRMLDTLAARDELPRGATPGKRVDAESDCDACAWNVHPSVRNRVAALAVHQHSQHRDES